jgi:hypothetical protein
MVKITIFHVSILRILVTACHRYRTLVTACHSYQTLITACHTYRALCVTPRNFMTQNYDKNLDLTIFHMSIPRILVTICHRYRTLVTACHSYRTLVTACHTYRASFVTPRKFMTLNHGKNLDLTKFHVSIPRILVTASHRYRTLVIAYHSYRTLVTACHTYRALSVTPRNFITPNHGKNLDLTILCL